MRSAVRKQKSLTRFFGYAVGAADAIADGSAVATCAIVAFVLVDDDASAGALRPTPVVIAMRTASLRKRWGRAFTFLS